MSTSFLCCNHRAHSFLDDTSVLSSAISKLRDFQGFTDTKLWHMIQRFKMVKGIQGHHAPPLAYICTESYHINQPDFCVHVGLLIYIYYATKQHQASVHLSILSSPSLSVHPSVCLSVYLSICSSICLFIHLCVSLTVRLSAGPSVCLSIRPSIHPLSVHLSICLSVCRSVCPSIHPSVYLFLCYHAGALLSQRAILK